MALRVLLVVLIAILGHVPGTAHGAHLHRAIAPVQEAAWAYAYDCDRSGQRPVPLRVGSRTHTSDAAPVGLTARSTSNCEHLRASARKWDRLIATRGTTTLFRAVSEAEFKQLMTTGKFAAGPNSLGGKFFAETAEHAAKWGEAMMGKGGFRIIQADLPTSAADKLMRWERLDGIGPARYGELEQLVDAVVRAFR
jgi:hypothetical protein